MAIELDDGTIVRSLPEQVSYNDERINEQREEIDTLAARIESALAGVLHYKGSVATYADLPADAEIGDVYNVIDTGANYAWTGTEWDELGQTVDLSNLVAKTGINIMEGDYQIKNSLMAKLDFKTGSHDGVIGLNPNGDFVVNIDGNAERAISPKYDNKYSIGKTTSKWKELNVYTINLGTSGVLKYENSAFSFNDDIIPAVTKSYDLGSDTNCFRDLFLYGKARIYYTSNDWYDIQPNVSGSYWDLTLSRNGSSLATFYRIDSSKNGLSLDADVHPFSNNNRDLGTTARQWKDLYLAGKINPNSSGYGLTLPDTSGYTADSEVVDTESTQTIAGEKTFNDLRIQTDSNPYWTFDVGATYMDIASYFSGALRTILSLSQTEVITRVRFRPNNDNDKDLGTSSQRWKDLYLAGNLTDGTNSVNIADLKALIDYAKAQGWIS